MEPRRTAEPPTEPQGNRILPVRPTAAGAIGGVLGAVSAIALAELLAALVPGVPSLLASVGRWVIDSQPPGAKEFVVALFGTNDKLALELFILLVSGAVGALLGGLSLRSFRFVSYGFLAFGAIGFIAALRDSLVAPAFAAVTTATATAVGIGIVSWLSGVGGERPSPTQLPWARAPNWSRRGFIIRSGGIAVGALAAGLAGRWLIGRSAEVRSPLPIPEPGTVVGLPEGADLGLEGLTPIVVPNEDFYRIDTALVVPSVEVASWTLRVTGMVARETTLTYEELVALPMAEQYVTIACVSNEVGGDLVGNAKWTGPRLRDVLATAGVKSSADQLIGESVDGFTAGMPLSWVMDPARDPLIAVKMNGEPLPVRHGYPARLIIPGLYGYVSATKWLSELRLTTFEAEAGYWIPLGWAREAPILTQARIDLPRRGDIQAGPQKIAGVAWAPDRGVSRVEVQVDGGAWQDARLSTPISDATWVQWVVDWDAAPGQHTITARATDGTGVTQTDRRTRPDPDGARGWPSREVTVIDT